jgi:hypothetical protein
MLLLDYVKFNHKFMSSIHSQFPAWEACMYVYRPAIYTPRFTAQRVFGLTLMCMGSGCDTK